MPECQKNGRQAKRPAGKDSRAPVEPTSQRRAEVGSVLARTRALTHRRDIVAVGLAGSWAKGGQTMDSDLDLIVLTTEKEAYLRDESWMRELGGVEIIRTQDWGPLYTERRFVTASGLEVELGVAPPEWAATDPPDPNIREDVGSGGLRPVYDPGGIFKRLIRVCRELCG